MPRTGRYRGRRRITRLLSGIAVTLVIASVLAVTAFLFLRDYITRTDEGLLLSLPFLNKENTPTSEPAEETPPPPDLDTQIIIETTPEPTPAPTPEPEPIPVSAQVQIKSAFLSQSDLKSTEKLDELSELCDMGEVDTIVFEMKATSGVIATVTSILTNVIERFDDRVKIVAYFSALEDNSITRQRGTYGIKHTSGVNWLDANKSRWLNPYIPDVREWLAVQLSAIDPEIFSAVIIDKLWFPTVGRLEQMVLSNDVPQDEILTMLKNELISSTTLPCWFVDEPTQEITFDGNVLSVLPKGAFNP